MEVVIHTVLAVAPSKFAFYEKEEEPIKNTIDLKEFYPKDSLSVLDVKNYE